MEVERRHELLQPLSHVVVVVVVVVLTMVGRYDSRVKAMEVDERPTEQYGDIGGLDKQIQEVHCFV